LNTAVTHVLAPRQGEGEKGVGRSILSEMPNREKGKEEKKGGGKASGRSACPHVGFFVF